MPKPNRKKNIQTGIPINNYELLRRDLKILSDYTDIHDKQNFIIVFICQKAKSEACKNTCIAETRVGDHVGYSIKK